MSLAAGCGDEPIQKRPSFLLYVIDTLRADRLGAYGYEGPTSPNIDEIARNSLLFDRAHAPAPWTLPSVVSLMTSTYLTEHGVDQVGAQLAPGQPTLPMHLRALGYRTAAFVANPLASTASSLQRGWEFVSKVDRAPAPADVAAWLDSVGDEPFFLYIHTMEPHRKYEAPERLVERMGGVDRRRYADALPLFKEYKQLRRADWQAGKPIGTIDLAARQTRLLEELELHRDQIEKLYDAGVAWADENLATIAEVLRRRGLWNDVHFIVISDHGEELFDRGGLLHGQSVNAELTRVPFIWKLPGSAERSGVVGDNVTLLDVAPTLVELAGGDASSKGFRGRSLRALLLGTGSLPSGPLVSSIRRNRMHSYEEATRARGNENVAVVDGSWKAIWNADPDVVELYDLDTDPHEINDVSELHGDVVERLRSIAKGVGTRAVSARPRQELDPESLSRLRELGYVN